MPPPMDLHRNCVRLGRPCCILHLKDQPFLTFPSLRSRQDRSPWMSYLDLDHFVLSDFPLQRIDRIVHILHPFP